MRILILEMLCLLSLGAFAQGTFVAENRDLGTSPPIDAPIIHYAGPSVYHGYVGTEASAQFFVGPVGAPSSSLIPVGPVYHFDTRLGYAGYIVAGDVLTVPNIPGGATAAIELRAWLGDPSSWGAGTARGSSSPLTVVLGNQSLNGGPPTLPASLVGLQGFDLDFLDPPGSQLPEPSVIAFASLGVAGLFFRRRLKVLTD